MSPRPKYLNLLQIRMPAPAVVSILHRISGALLFAALPVLLWWLQQSLVSPDSYASYRSLFSGWLFKIIALVMVIYTILFPVAVIRAPQLDHAAWRAIFVPQWMKLASLLFMLCIFMH